MCLAVKDVPQLVQTGGSSLFMRCRWVIFPKDPVIRLKCLQACKFNESYILPNRKLCSFHFEEHSCYTGQHKTFIKRGAIPTLHMKNEYNVPGNPSTSGMCSSLTSIFPNTSMNISLTSDTDKLKQRKSVSFAQKEALISYMQSHPELHKGKFSSTFTSQKSKVLWQKIANELNSIVGATKEPSKWKKCWIDLKSNVKTKSVEYKKSCRKTGGGDNENEKTDKWEDKILNLIGDVPVNGHPNTAEPVVSFEGFQMVVDTERLDESNDVLLEVTDIQHVINDTKLAGKITDQPKSDDPFINAINDIRLAGKIIDQPNLTTNNSKSKLGVLKQSVNASMHIVESNDTRNEIIKSYYIAKLLLLKRITEAKEKIAAALERKFLM
ncbi:hypothetical protein ACI65C_004066 [Semiaphis heraclei]